MTFVSNCPVFLKEYPLRSRFIIRARTIQQYKVEMVVGVVLCLHSALASERASTLVKVHSVVYTEISTVESR